MCIRDRLHTAPAEAHSAAAEVLAGLDPTRREAFGLRLDRWYEDLISGLEHVYPEHNCAALALALVRHAAAAYRDRDPELHRLDEARLLRPDWLQQPEMVGYACYADRFAGTLAGVGEHAGYLEELGVHYLHLMPLLRPRDGDNDGGYAVADYRTIRPDLGTVEDLRALATTLRHRGISLVLDLVLNHVAREHEAAVGPEVLLLDDPTGALDPIATARIEGLLADLRESLTLVVVTHAPQQAARVSQRTALFHEGRLVEVGDTRVVFTRPRERLTQDYLTGRYG